MKRRTYLATGGAVLAPLTTGGCVFGRASRGLSLEPIEDLEDHFVLRPDELDPVQAELVEEGIRTGSATTIGRRPFRARDHLLVDGNFYRVDVDRVGEIDVERAVLVAVEVSGEGDVEARAVTPSDLPREDREPAIVALRLARSRTATETRGADRASPPGYVIRPPAPEMWYPEVDPRYDRIEFEGQLYRLRIEEHVVSEPRYRWRFQHVADDPAGFQDHLDRVHVIELERASLTEPQRELLEEATDADGYVERGEATTAFVDLTKRIRDAELEGRTVVAYDGQYYTWSTWHGD